MDFSEIKSLARKCLMNNVARYDLSLAKGRGLKVWDSEGREYYDFIGGIAVCALGHSPPALAEALSRQARRLIHISNLFYSEELVLAARELTRATGLARAFFCNSGVEANEAAIKLARRHSYNKYGPGRAGIITALNSFHGRSLGAIAASGQDRMRLGFGPDLPGFSHVPFGDFEALAREVGPETCAVMLEPIQGEAGVILPPPGYLPQVAELCRKLDLLLILDEIQTGFGRTGRGFACQHYGLTPNIMSLAKALGGGLPVGALAADEETARAFEPGSHSTTVGGAPLSMAAARAMMGEIFKPGFIENVRAVGDYFLARLKETALMFPERVKEARGQGLLLGLELKIPAPETRLALQEKGFLVNSVGASVLRMTPPLIITSQEVDVYIAALRAVLKEAAPAG